MSMKKKEVKRFGEVLQEAREAVQMNLRMAAEALYDAKIFRSVDHSSIYRYERGERLPKIEILLGLCKIYGVRPSTLFSRAGLDNIEAPLEEILKEREDGLEIEANEETGEGHRCMLYLPDILHEESYDLAQARGLSFSRFVRKLLRRELRIHKARVERRRQAG